MRLVIWNCNMALHRKLDALASLRPDVAVICECANPEIVRAKSESRLSDSVVWVGENKNKGIAVFGLGPWRVRLDNAYDPSIRYVVPVHVDGPTPFRMLAVWAFNRRGHLDEMGRGPLMRGLRRYGRFCEHPALVVGGDFNNNAIWCNPKNPAHSHSADVAELEKRGVFSAYHHMRNVRQGQEPEPTLFWRDRKADGRNYHIDYIFVSAAWIQALRSVELGGFAPWVRDGLSDHVPLIAGFEFAGAEGSALRHIPQ